MVGLTALFPQPSLSVYNRPMLLLLLLLAGTLSAQTWDVVIGNGRVVDPESGLDAVRWVGIRGGSIGAVSATALEGRTVIDARGLVVAPGFIDLHEHGQDFEAYTFQARDGVTSSFRTRSGDGGCGGLVCGARGEIGDQPRRLDRPHTGPHESDEGPRRFSAVRAPARTSRRLPQQIEEMKRLMDAGFRQGAVAAGFGMVYTPAASRWEILEMFRLAASIAPPATSICVVDRPGRQRNRRPGSRRSSRRRRSRARRCRWSISTRVRAIERRRCCKLLREARARGLDVTTEMYPYIAGCTRIESASFDDWMDRPASAYQSLQWMATGERLTRESFLKYRKQGGNVITFTNTEDMIEYSAHDPLPMIASDGFGFETGTSHPRSAGTFSRILGVYVREKKLMTVAEALRKMTLAPAQRLEARVPAMKKKGRIQEGADADVTIFDPATVRDRSTFEHGKVPSEGIRHVMVGGTFVVRDGNLTGATPGRAIRAPL